MGAGALVHVEVIGIYSQVSGINACWDWSCIKICHLHSNIYSAQLFEVLMYYEVPDHRELGFVIDS